MFKLAKTIFYLLGYILIVASAYMIIFSLMEIVVRNFDIGRTLLFILVLPLGLVFLYYTFITLRNSGWVDALTIGGFFLFVWIGFISPAYLTPVCDTSYDGERYCVDDPDQQFNNFIEPYELERPDLRWKGEESAE